MEAGSSPVIRDVVEVILGCSHTAAAEPGRAVVSDRDCKVGLGRHLGVEPKSQT